MDGILGDEVKAGDVVVIRYEGPKGGPGMQEMLYPTSYLKSKGLGQGLRAGHRRPLLGRHLGPVDRPRLAGSGRGRRDRPGRGRRPHRDRHPEPRAARRAVATRNSRAPARRDGGARRRGLAARRARARRLAGAAGLCGADDQCVARRRARRRSAEARSLAREPVLPDACVSRLCGRVPPEAATALRVRTRPGPRRRAGPEGGCGLVSIRFTKGVRDEQGPYGGRCHPAPCRRTLGLQGLGIVGGSFMTGQRQWLVIGVLTGVVGLVLLLWSNLRET